MAYDRTLLSPLEVERFTQDNQGWAVEGGALVKKYVFTGFLKAIEYVVGLAQLAEQQNHHPDIDIRYREVRLRLSTHDAGGLTERDPALARAADELYSRKV